MERSEEQDNALDDFDPILLKVAIEGARLGTFDYDVAANCCRWNRRLKEMVALPPSQPESFDSFAAMLHPEDRQKALTAVRAALDPEGNGLYACEMRLVSYDGGTLWVSAAGQGVFDTGPTGRFPVRLVGIVRDVSQRVALLRQKDLLVREMSHRVKNSLQAALTMLDLQARFIGDGTARSELDEARGRIQSVAQVHQHLYQASDPTRIAIGDYLRNLVTELAVHLPVGVTEIDWSTTGDNLAVPTDDVLNVGLIVNELITNACKYAFVGRVHGCVTVSIHDGGQNVEIRVADDGVGLSRGVDPLCDGNLGMTIVRSVVEQLEGALFCERGTGTCFIVRFPKR